ncbi:hypothetical protein Cgig2_012064 [Carnegiea gigantea]|uniref:SAM domain-containing protein n=1 Tax=Carnegiea gigantea TaxID=171969 RepID=A0A9Q1QN52_9CARY|nr:hypothetical protein Cgig2_012064 [Carnegiea gigantea]
MYADRLEDEARTSIKDRLTGNVLEDSACRLSVTGKRQREDDKWKHHLYEDEQPQISRKLGGGDLRLKLRRKSSQQDTNTGGARDLREKLSGIILSQHVKKDPQKPKPEPETVKPTRKSADASVDGFLQSLGLEKYLITFQAEEVDMTALEHMTDDDLKAMGIPMGPRKKILLALKSGG